jgi:hypothetical protein
MLVALLLQCAHVPVSSSPGRSTRGSPLWLGSLAALAAFNVGLWIWIARSVSLHTPYAETQLQLSGVYVGVCGFRDSLAHVTPLPGQADVAHRRAKARW